MLEKALEVANALCSTLAAEVERARAERVVLSSLRAEAVFASAARRTTFNAEVARLGEELSRALRASAADLGGELSLARLAVRSPAESEALRRVVADLRGHAATLAELDRINRTLAARALSYVNGYLGLLRPVPAAYDRRGAHATLQRSGGYSSKA
jgi:hypothetical protein